MCHAPHSLRRGLPKNHGGLPRVCPGSAQGSAHALNTARIKRCRKILGCVRMAHTANKVQPLKSYRATAPGPCCEDWMSAGRRQCASSGQCQRNGAPQSRTGGWRDACGGYKAVRARAKKRRPLAPTLHWACKGGGKLIFALPSESKVSFLPP